jgi:CheY-like chemotaxis protein
MPKLNGVDTVLAIRELCPSTKILLFSGQAGTTNILEAARAEGHEFEMLPKPIHPEQLLKKLSTLAQS